MHHKLFSVAGSGGVKGVAALVGHPVKFREPVIIAGVNEGELAAGKRDPPDRFCACLERTARIEIGAFTVDMHPPPSTDEIYPLHTHQHRPIRSHHPQRKKTIITTFMIFNFQLSIFYLYPIRVY